MAKRSTSYQQNPLLDFYHEKRGKVWYFRFRDPDTGLIGNAVSSRCTNEKQAFRWAETRWQELSADDSASEEVADILFGTLAAPYFLTNCAYVARKKLDLGHYAETTRTQNRALLEKHIIGSSLAAIPLRRIKKAHVLAFRTEVMNSVGEQRRTANKVMAIVSIIFKDLMYKELYDRDPTLLIGKVKYAKAERNPLALDEILLYLKPENFSKQVYFDMANWAFQTGMRAGEIRALTLGDVDAVKKVIDINKALRENSSTAGDPKWGKKRRTAFPDSLLYLVKDRTDEKKSTYLFSQTTGHPVSYKLWKDAMKAAGPVTVKNWLKEKEKLGIVTPPEEIERMRVVFQNITPHVMRHTLNNILLETGTNEELIRASLGWSNRKTQDGYTHAERFSLAPVSAAVDALSGSIHTKMENQDD